MKQRLYKFIDMRDLYTACEVFDAVKVLNETELRKEFFDMVSNGIITHKEIDDYRADPDYKLDGGFTKIGTILDMINDTCNYDGRYFMVNEIDVEIGEQNE